MKKQAINLDELKFQMLSLREMNKVRGGDGPVPPPSPPDLPEGR